MVVSAAMLGLINLGLYCAQQLGVMLGVGAETVILVAYLLAMRDGVRDEKEERFARIVKRVLFSGLALIVLSGATITALEFVGGHGAIVFAPVYLFKCALIVVLLLLPFMVRGSSLPAGLLEGAVGGTWYALFVVHILAPMATWKALIIIYALGLLGFMICWTVLVISLRGGKKIIAVQPIPKTTPTPAPTPKPASVPAFARSSVSAPMLELTAPTPLLELEPAPTSAPVFTTVVTTEVGASFIPNPAPVAAPNRPLPPPPTPASVAKQMAMSAALSAVAAAAAMPPAPAPTGLPTMRLMPRTAEDLKTQHRGPSVRFG